MASKRKPEGLQIILCQVLVAVLTLITVIPLIAVLALSSRTLELVVVLIVFGAWFLVISMITPFFQKRGLGRDPERIP
jgi:hypothetical protein